MYFIAKEELPLSKFSPLLNLQIKNQKEDLKNITHQHPSHVSEMVGIISDSTEKKDLEILNRSPVVGVLLDETSDITIHKKLVILFKAFQDGECKTLFRKNVSVHNGKADTLVQALIQLPNSKGIPVVKVLGLV